MCISYIIFFEENLKILWGTILAIILKQSMPLSSPIPDPGYKRKDNRVV